MNSNQEKLISLISENSFGAPFIFAPDEYKKGNAIREPADLICVCNNTIFLIYAKSKNKPKKELIEETILSRRKKLIEENTNQLEGWLREWKNGRNITGKNDFCSFDISFGEYQNIVGIGIIDYTENFGIFHKEIANKLNLKYCITISNDSFIKIFKSGFSLLDLAILIKSISLISKDNIITVNNLIENYLSSSIKKNSIDKIDINILNSTDIYFNNLKSLINSDEKWKVSKSIPEILNDLKLYETIKIKYQISKILEKLNEDTRQYLVVLIPLEKYRLVIAFSSMQNWDSLIGMFNEDVANNKTDDGLIGMIYDLNTSCPIINICFERKNESTIEKFLK